MAKAALNKVVKKAAISKKPRSLKQARKAGPDDLTVIKGIGPKIHGQLNDMGVFHWDQIADWKKT